MIVFVRTYKRGLNIIFETVYNNRVYTYVDNPPETVKRFINDHNGVKQYDKTSKRPETIYK